MFKLKNSEHAYYTMRAVSCDPSRKVLRSISGLTVEEAQDKKLFPYGIQKDKKYGEYFWVTLLTKYAG